MRKKIGWIMGLVLCMMLLVTVVSAGDTDTFDGVEYVSGSLSYDDLDLNDYTANTYFQAGSGVAYWALTQDGGTLILDNAELDELYLPLNTGKPVTIKVNGTNTVYYIGTQVDDVTLTDVIITGYNGIEDALTVTNIIDLTSRNLNIENVTLDIVGLNSSSSIIMSNGNENNRGKLTLNNAVVNCENDINFNSSQKESFNDIISINKTTGTLTTNSAIRIHVSDENWNTEIVYNIHGNEDICYTGLSSVPETTTTYLAGNGTVTVTPGTPVKITLDNAAIYDIYISDSVELHLKGSNELLSCYFDSVTVTGDGSLKCMSIRVENTFEKTGNCEVNTLVYTIDTNSIAVYGDVVLQENIIIGGDGGDADDAYSSFTIMPDATLMLSDASNFLIIEDLECFHNQGKIVNDITMVIYSDTTSSNVIASWGLEGAGLVCVVTTDNTPTYYTNDGTELRFYSNYFIDESNLSEGNLETHGYQWDSDSNTLTLKNVLLYGIRLPSSDVTIVVDGAAHTTGLDYISASSNNILTIKSENNGILYIGGYLDTLSNVLIQDVTVHSNIMNANENNAALLKLQNATLYSSTYFQWAPLSGIELAEKSSLVVAENLFNNVDYGYFWVETIKMGADSSIYVGAPIQNRGKVSTGWNDLKDFLPNQDEYGVGSYIDEFGQNVYTVYSTTTNEPAYGFWLKMNQSTDDDENTSSGGSGGSGTGSGSTTPPSSGETTETPWYQSKFAASAYFSTVLFTANATDGGTITPVGRTVVPMGASITYTITPDDNHILEDVLVDGKSVGAVSSYTFEKVWRGHKINAVFAEKPMEPALDTSDAAVDADTTSAE